MGLLGQILRDRALAEDAYQETWCALWKSRERLDQGRDLWPLIRLTGVRKAIDQRRSRRKQPRLLEVADLEPCIEEPSSVPDLGALLDRLPHDQRACLLLFFWEELSIREISGILDIPENTVKTRLFRGRSALREVFDLREEHRHEMR